MSCEGCARTLEKALKKEAGVFDARVSYERGEAWIEYDDEKITLDKLRQIIKSAGFDVVPETGETSGTERTNIASPAARNFSKNLDELGALFNRDRGKVRLLMLLSPT
jgi:copper chaperone CopZ